MIQDVGAGHLAGGHPRTGLLWELSDRRFRLGRRRDAPQAARCEGRRYLRL